MGLYALAIVRLFRGSLLLLVVLLAFAALLYHRTPQAELGGQAAPWQLSLYAAWMAMFGEPVFQRPDALHLVILQGVYPLFGVVLIGEGIVRLGLLMVSRQRGEKEWMQVMASTYRNHVVLCGLGNLGYRVLEQLILQRRQVVVIEKNPQTRFADLARAEGVPLIVRDMMEDVALLEAGIKHASALILATDDDLANVEAAIDARRLNPSLKVAVRLFDQQLAGKLKDVLAFDNPFSSSALAAPAVAAMTLGHRVIAAFSLAGVAHVSVELEIERRSQLVGTTVSAFETERALRVLARVPRKGDAEIPPPPGAVIDDGDDLTLHLPVNRLAEIATLARGGSAPS